MAFWDGKKDNSATQASNSQQADITEPLKARIASLERQIQVLEGQNNSYQALESGLRDQCEALSFEIASVKPKLLRYEAIYGPLNSSSLPTNTESDTQADDSDLTPLQRANIEVRAYADKIVSLQVKLEELEKSIDTESAGKIAELTEELRGIKEQHNKLLAERDKLNSDLASSNQQLAHSQTRIANLEKLVKTAHTAFEKMKSVMNSKPAASGTVDSQALRDRDAQIDMLNQRISSLNSANTELIETNQGLEKQLVDFQDKTSALEKTIVDQSTNITSLNLQIDSISEKLSSTSNELSQLQTEYSSTNEQCIAFRTRAEGAEEKIAALQSDLDIANARISELEKYEQIAKSMSSLLSGLKSE